MQNRDMGQRAGTEEGTNEDSWHRQSFRIILAWTGLLITNRFFFSGKWGWCKKVLRIEENRIAHSRNYSVS